MKLRHTFVALAVAAALALATSAQTKAPDKPGQLFTKALFQLALLVEPAAEAEPQTFSARLSIEAAQGLPSELVGRSLALAFQAPDRVRVEAELEGRAVEIGRRGDELWVRAPAKGFAVLGKPGVARFAAEPDELDDHSLAPFRLPFGRDKLALVPFVFEFEERAAEEIEGERCRAIVARPSDKAIETFGIPAGEIGMWVRERDLLPARLSFRDQGGLSVTLALAGVALEPAWADERWALRTEPGETLEIVALSHLARFFPTALAALFDEAPTLPPARDERRVIATEGQGQRLDVDGTTVLLLAGTPEEMGRQHGVLMRAEVLNLVERVLYGVGVGTSFEKGRWFFGEIEEAQRRLMPFMNPRYVREMDALAQASGLEREEVRLSNFFPELFHCSGFAVFGKATEGGRMYHGRILDYMKGIGLEQSAAVIVVKPDQGNAWVNVGYAGFVGSVTAMNEKHIAIGEMGGRGEGNWDGVPMAQLLREVMEQADTIDEAVLIMRRAPRTCEYYYVVSDGQAMRAVGIAASPERFETIWAGESHEQLPHAVEDTVLLSGGSRYEKLVERVRAGYGKIDAAAARDLMLRPVAMSSNIHSVLFAPDTLDFWVANADSKNVASHARYTRYNLAELLGLLKEEKVARGGGQ